MRFLDSSRRRSVGTLAGFTLLEVMIVVVVMGILAALVVPQMAAAGSHAKSAAVQSALGAVRAGIASYRTRAIIAGDSPFPTAAQLGTLGVVLNEEIPSNPYSGLRTVQEVSASDAAARTVLKPEVCGWNYFVDNKSDPATAVFYCNSSELTEISGGSGALKKANQL